jgi:hypothetical protein
MRSRALPVLLVLLASCTSPTEPPDVVLQAFELTTIDDQPLPEMTHEDAQMRHHMLDEEIAILDDGRARLTARTVDVMIISGSALPEETHTKRRTMVMEGDSIKIYLANSCTTAGCDLEARGTIIGAEMLLIRPEWSAFKIYKYALLPAAP